MLELFASGFGQVASPEMFLLLGIGVVLGIVFGASPGISTSMGMILILPATYSMSLPQSMAIFLALYVGGVSGGLITAILLNIPGTPASVPTTFDGHPMARDGKAGKALSVGIIYSFLGGMFSFIFLFFLAPTISRFAIRFSNIDYFSISIFALMLVASLAGKSLLKGIGSALAGIAFATVGLSPVDGVSRFTFNFVELNAGFTLVTVLIGVYAVNEVLDVAGAPWAKPMKAISYRMRGFDISWAEFRQQFSNFLLSASIGSGIGFLPGIGSGTASMLSYSIVRNRSKYPENFGTGIIDGIVASEASNNAVIGGALIPLLTMGIPGDAGTAILLSAFMMHGVTPGPLLFRTDANLVYFMFACLVVANVLMLVFEYFGMSIFLRLMTIPKHILLPIIMVLCAIGAFGVNNRTFDVASIIVFAVVGFVFSKFKYPIPPFIMGYILCPIVESNLMRGLMLTKGSLILFITRPVSATFLSLMVVYLFFVVYRQCKPKRT